MRALILCLSAALCGCVSTPDLAFVNPAPAPQPAAASTFAPPLEGDVLALAFSGGGARAAAFAYGATQGLKEMRAADGAPLLDHVRLVTGVSGGSILAAYLAQNGPEGIDGFRAAYLDKDWARDLNMNLFSPLNWLRASNGGLNGSQAAADWLDREVFDHGRLDDLNHHGIRAVINATDIFNGTPFAFTPFYFETICADLSSVRIADAVAASMAFPLVFQPVLLEPHPGQCPQPGWVDRVLADRQAPLQARRTAQAVKSYHSPNTLTYLHLVDGGVVDNLGLSTLELEAAINDPLEDPAPENLVRLNSMTFLVVNAEQIRQQDWQKTREGPDGVDVAAALSNILIESPNRTNFDSFRLQLQDREKRIAELRCALPDAQVIAVRGTLDGWKCDAVRLRADVVSFADLGEPLASELGQIETQVSLPREDIDKLVAAGRQAIMANETARALAKAALGS